MKRKMMIGIIQILCLLFLTSCNQKEALPYDVTSDLVVYVTGAENIARPIIREFENRNHVKVEVRQEEMEDLILTQAKMSQAQFDGDVIFGMTERVARENADLFPERRFLISSTMVMAYNVNLISKRDVPKNFHSLLDDKWKNKIGFVNPEESTKYQIVLQTARNEFGNNDGKYLSSFYKNVEGNYAETMDDVALGITEGKYPLGIITEEKAKSMQQDHSNIVYMKLGKNNYTVNEVVVKTSNTSHEELADRFMEFVDSDVVDLYLTEYVQYQTTDGKEKK